MRKQKMDCCRKQKCRLTACLPIASAEAQWKQQLFCFQRPPYERASIASGAAGETTDDAAHARVHTVTQRLR